MKFKFKNTLLVSFLAIAGILGVSSTLINKQVNEQPVAEKAEASTPNEFTTIILKDTVGWCFRTLWLDAFDYEGDYKTADRNTFIETYYGSVIDPWDPQSTTRGYKYSNTGVNLCAGGDSGTYTFYLPKWITTCTIQVENSGNQHLLRTIDNLATSSTGSSPSGSAGSGVGKVINIEVKAGSPTAYCSVSNEFEPVGGINIFLTDRTDNWTKNGDPHVQLTNVVFSSSVGMKSGYTNITDVPVSSYPVAGDWVGTLASKYSVKMSWQWDGDVWNPTKGKNYWSKAWKVVLPWFIDSCKIGFYANGNSLHNRGDSDKYFEASLSRGRDFYVNVDADSTYDGGVFKAYVSSGNGSSGTHFLYHENKYNVTINGNGSGAADTSDTVLKNAYLDVFPTREGYTFSKYTTGASSSSDTVNRITSDCTIYAQWTINNYDIYIRPVLDGVRQTHFESDSLKINCSGAHTFSEYESAPAWTNFIYGYSFEGFYSTLGGDGKLSGSLSTSYMSAAPWESSKQYAYAKYVRLSTNKTFYCYVPSSSALTGESTISVQYWKTKGTSGADSFWPGVRLVAQTGVANMYSFTIPADAIGFLINNGNGSKSGYAQCQTVNLYPGTGADATRYANGHNMFVVTTNNPSSNQTGVWKDIVYQLGGYWDGNTSGTWQDLIMSAPTDDSGNQAELRHVTVSGNAQFKVSMVYQNSAGETIKYWFGHCGTSYTFLDYSQTNTTDGAAGGDGYRNGKFKSSLSSGHNSYSFYFKAGIIYIEDDYNESAAGYLYFANAAYPESIKVTATNSASQTIQSNVKITSIDGTESVSNLTFNNGSTNIKGMHKISLYNLRGNNTGAYITSLTISDGTNSQTYTWAAATTGNPSIYIDITSSTQDSSAKGPAASLAFAVSQAITSSANSSVCNVPEATAAVLCEAYDDLSASAKSSFTSAKITTWNSAKPTYSGSQDVSMNAILYRLNSIYDNGESRGVLAGFNGLLFGNQENELSTIIIIVASSVALLSITALSILVIRKRKTKEQ